MSKHSAAQGRIPLLKRGIAGWAHRQTMLSFCIQTVNSSIEAKNPAGLSGADEKLIGTSTSAAGGSRQRGWKEDEVLVGHTHNE